VQCKHFAHANRSVGVDDLDNIVDSCVHHNATGYLLACSTQPSSAVVNRLEGVTTNPANAITATFWDAVTIERLLSRPRQWAIAQRFFPLSAGNWQIYATDRPNDFVAHYRGYVFHLTNRIGSSTDHLLPSIESRIAEIERIKGKLPKGQFIRPRAVWYDDKNGGFTWYIDYMYSNDAQPAVSEAQLATALHDGWALEDGQIYHWDIKFVQYWPDSDHYDQDHYDYYVRYMPNFLDGAYREDEENSWHRKFATAQKIAEIEKKAKEAKDVAFNAMVEAFRKLDFVKLVGAINAGIEAVARFERRYVWSDIIEGLDQNALHLFDALIILEVSDESRFHDLLSTLPNDVGSHFRVSRVYIYSGKEDEGLAHKDDAYMFDLKLSIHPSLMNDQASTRKAFDSYFDAIRSAIEKFAKA
jgi:hypothetical protein